MSDRRDTCTLSEFREHAAEHLDRLAATGRVEVLTIDGEARGVVAPVEVFDQLLRRVEDLEIAASVRRGLDDVAAGRVYDGRETIAEMRAKLRDLPASRG